MKKQRRSKGKQTGSKKGQAPQRLSPPGRRAKESPPPEPIPVGREPSPHTEAVVAVPPPPSAARADAHKCARSRLPVARILLFAAVAAGTVLAAFSYALMHTPRWYTPPVVAPHARQAVRNNLLSAEQAFTENLMAGGPFTYHLFAEDINRWIAARKEIYPLIDDLVPPLLEDPVVEFDNSRITVGGRYRIRDLSVVISIDITARIEQDSIVLKANAVKCGSVRMPLAFGRVGLDLSIDRPENRTWPGSPRMWGSFLTGFHVGTRAWWKNGGIDYQITGLAVEPGTLNLDVMPLGRHVRTRQNSHSDP